MIGRKPVTIGALLLFIIGTVICGSSPGVAVLLVGRTIQGAGTGMIIAMTFVIFTDLFSLRERGKWLGLVGAVWLLGAIVGPVAGGAFAQFVTWVIITT